ncbi:aKG-HExxH-type peptide beta-hydroxylase [Streptomyces phaeochromogenes]|uniref:aKG-HExxH-type peptide beta-hydroxylase n=1 Tax=Streptomyces phaeochromogenes TaxID=1923 RepID=UPI00340856C5
MTDPFVRAWSLRLLRRLEGVRNAGNSGPLWADLGQFQAVAAAAAVRAGFATELRVPVYRGTAWLPATGVVSGLSQRRWSRAVVRADPAGAVVRGEGVEIRLPGPGQLSRPAQGWRPVHSLLGGVPQPDIQMPVPVVRLDVVTPYRDMVAAVRSPGRVSGDQLTTWIRRVNGAWELLVREVPADAAALAGLVTCLVPRPVPDGRGSQVASASSADAFGAVTMALPSDIAGTAAVLVHETRHQQLNAVLCMVPLLDASSGGTEAIDPRKPRLHYSPWRSAPRPAHGLIHGIFAFAGVAGFWRSHRQVATASEARRAHFEFAVLREQLWDATGVLLDSGELTEAGLVFTGEIAGIVEHWSRERVPAESARLARDYVSTRRAMWRVRHMAVGRQAGQRIAVAWRFGKSPPPMPSAVLRPRLDTTHRDSRRMLTELYLRTPVGFDRLRRGAQRSGDHVRAAEAAAIVGDYTEAARCYARLRAADPADPEAWIGAALASPETEPSSSSGLLLSRPEVVAGAYEAIVEAGAPAPDPVLLTEWLASG